MAKQEFRTGKSEATFERVRETALSLFAEKGFEATTMREISAASGLGLGALYYYFRSKEDVVLSFYESVNRAVEKEFEAAPRGKNSAESFRILMEIKLRELGPHRHLLRTIIKEAVDPKSRICPLNPDSEKPLGLSLAIFQTIAAQNSRLSPGEIHDMARGLWALHMGLLGYWIHDRSSDSGALDGSATQKAIDCAVSLLLWSERMTKIPGFSALRTQILGLVVALFPATTGPNSSEKTP